MKKVIFTAALVVATLSIFSSCEKQKFDNEKPVVNLIAPKDGAKLKIGDAHGVHFDMEVKDNVMLKSYKIDVHNNFDNHTHAGEANGHDHEKLPPFKFLKVYDLEGKKNAKIHHHDIVIPEGVHPGNYHLVVFVTDAAGNETVVARNVILGAEGDHHHDHDHDHDHGEDSGHQH